MNVQKSNFEWELILSKIGNALSENIQLPIGVSYRIIKNKIRIKNAIEAYLITKDGIINKYSDGRGYVSEREDMESFKKIKSEVDIISKEKTSVDIEMINISDLGERELPLNLIAAIEFMINI